MVPFKIDDYTAWRLLEGLDDIGLTLRKLDEIETFEAARPTWKPRTLPALMPNGPDGCPKSHAFKPAFRVAFHRRSAATGLPKSSLSDA